MPTVIQPLITNAGFAAALAQSGLGLQLAITHIQIGTGLYTLNSAEGSADYNRTSLVTPTETVAISAGHVTNNGFRVDAQFPAWTAAAYGASEVGFWAGNPASGGVLFAIWAQATPFVQRNNIDYLASFALGLARVPNGSVTVTFDTGLQQAIALVTYHEQAADPHPQYKKRQFMGVREYSANTVLTNANDVGWLICVTGSVPQTLPLASTVRAGDSVTIQALGGTVTIQRQGTDTIRVGGTSGLTSLTLNGSDYAELTRNAAGEWVVTGGTPLIPKLTGTITYATGTVAPMGAIKGNGALLSRTTYAALWAYAQTSGNLAVSDAAWLAGAFGSYSPGDGATTFRIPDLRGQHLRGADDGRGVVAGFGVGSVHTDQLLTHGHAVTDGGHLHAVNITSAGAGIDHTHGVSIASGVASNDHVHSGSTDAQGAHGHSVLGSTASGGLKSPGDPQANGLAAASGTSSSYVSQPGGLASDFIGAAAAHAHNFTTGGISANHTHNVIGNTGGTSVNHDHTVIGNTGAVGTGISIQNSTGGTEVRVKTVGALPCIYY